MARLAPAAGHELNPEQDQPTLAPERVAYGGREAEHQSNLYHEWLSQRARVYFAGLAQDEQARVIAMLGPGVAADLVEVPVGAVIERVNNRLVIG